MNLGLNTSISAIDSAAINEVTSQIFRNAETKDAQPTFKVDYSQFNRASQGIDLYSQRLSIEQTQQIAMRNAGLDINVQSQAVVASLDYLNKVAAQNFYGIPQKMDGKINIPQEEKNQDLNSREVVALPASSITSEINTLFGDSQGSNPFKFVSLTGLENEEDEKDSQNVSIFG